MSWSVCGKFNQHVFFKGTMASSFVPKCKYVLMNILKMIAFTYDL